MSLTLAATQLVAGSAGQASAIAYTLHGDELSGTPVADAFKVLAQGYLPTSPASLYSTPAATQTLVKRVQLCNVTAGAVVCAMFINGTGATNKAVGLTIPANGSAEWKDDGWTVLDASGNRLTAAGVGPAGPRGATWRGAYSGATPYVVDDIVRDQGSSWINVQATTGNAPPTLPTASNTWWQLLAQQGSQGIQGNPGTPGAPGEVPNSRTITAGGALTGGGDLSANRTITLAADAVTNLYLAPMAAATIKGNNTAGTAGPTDLTPAQLAAMLPNSNMTTKGMVQPGHKVSVLDYGADPTGTNDSTAAIEAAHAAVAAAGGGIVEYPKGTFKALSTIDLPGNFVVHRGAGRVATIIQPAFATGDAFSITGIFVFFEDLRIQGTGATARTSGYALNFTSTASNCGAFRVDVIYSHSAVKATGQLCRLENMNLRELGAGASGGAGILIDSFTDQVINGVVMDNPTNPAGFAGLRITNLSSLILTNSHFIHSTSCLEVAPTGTNTIPSIFATNVFFDNGVIGADFGGAVGSTIARCKFTQCWFSSHSQFGVRINNANVLALDFINCDFYGSPVGIEALSATDWSVRNSRISGCTTAGVRTTAGANHSFTVSDNFIGNGSSFGANGVGLNIQAGTYKRYQVLDNRGLESNTTPGIIDLGVVAAADQKIVANNLGALPSGALATLGADVTTSGTAAFVILTARVPANSVSVGTTFRCTVRGVTTGSGNPTFSVAIGSADPGATVVWTTAAMTSAAANGGGMDVLITVKSIGAGGTVTAAGLGYAAALVASSATATATAVNTTAVWFITLRVAMSALAFRAVNAVVKVE